MRGRAAGPGPRGSEATVELRGGVPADGGAGRSDPSPASIRLAPPPLLPPFPGWEVKASKAPGRAGPLARPSPGRAALGVRGGAWDVKRTRSVGQGQLLPPAAAAAQRGPCPNSRAARVFADASLAGQLPFLRNHAHVRTWPAAPVAATGSWSKSLPRPITCAFRVPQPCPLTASARSLSVPLGGQQPANT